MSWIGWASQEKVALLTEKMNERFSPAGSISSQLFQFAVLLIVLAAVIAMVYFLSKTLNVTKKNSLNTDFRSIYQKLCSIHHLNLMERLLIRKVIKVFGIHDPLLIFVEPKYFHSALTRNDFKANQTMLLQLLNKIFGFTSDKERFSQKYPQLQAAQSVTESPEMDFSQIDVPEMTCQDLFTSLTPLTETRSDENPFEKLDPDDVKQEEAPLEEVLSETMAGKKVFYPKIPGSQAFSSLASTIHEVRTEIASKSVQNHLLSGRENNRTFKVHDFADPISPEMHMIHPQIPVEKNRVEKVTVEEDEGQQRIFRIEDAHSEPHLPRSRPGEVFTSEDVALLEEMIAGVGKK